ncbi:MAG: DUF92 domain-containing protein [Chloroflexota bacterium]|jgi:uncharacterized protein (TIGR00297 family)
MWQSLFLAFGLSMLIVGLAYWRRSLAPPGAAAALLVGTLTFGLGGWVWGVLLAIFFVSSSTLSHYKEEQKQQMAEEKFDKTHRRDAGQVLANGGAGMLLATASFIWPSSLWFYLFVGVMATVTADTWATELGTLSRRPPRLITNGKQVEVGTSGGVSRLGTAVSFSGGLLIGLAAALLSPWQGFAPALALIAAGAMGGLSGSLFDSLLGATVQQIYYCPRCQKETEKIVHRCGQATTPLRGWRWLNNDWVNFTSSLVGGIVAGVIGWSIL